MKLIVIAQQVLLLLTLQNFAFADHQKVVIFYSSIGGGHISAATAIEAGIKAKSPETEVIKKNIRDFMNPQFAKLDEKIYWYLVKKHPQTFDRLYKALVQKNLRAPNLLSTDYSLDGLRDFLVSEKPETVITTHYGAAIALSSVRETGALDGMALAWLDTDYVTQFLPRVSKALDMSFLPHTSMKDAWVKAGVDPSKVQVTGLPVNPALFSEIDEKAFLESQHLDPNLPTILIQSGAEGVGDYETIVRSLASEFKGKIQIVAVCARSEKNFKNLERLASSGKLRSGVSLTLKRLIPSEELLNFIKASTLYITKAGGLSPTEAFAIVKPTVVMDVYLGHESENANLFEELGLAKVNRDLSTIGGQVRELLGNPTEIASMLAVQTEFRNSIAIEPIIDFALHAPAASSPQNLGVTDGTAIQRTDEALAKLNADSPAEVEIFLSDGISPDAKFSSPDANRFGHVSIRVGDRSFTVNQNAGPEDAFFIESSIRDYLYGVESPHAKAEIGSHYGISYSRNSLGIRVGGVSPAQVSAMQAEVKKIEAEWKQGAIQYSVLKSNCASFTDRILAAGGLSPKNGKLFGFHEPRRFFEKVLSSVEARKDLRVELVSYLKVPGSKNYYSFSEFPISPSKPFDYLRRTLSSTPGAPPLDLTLKIGKRIAAYAKDPNAHYENVNGKKQCQEVMAGAF